MLKVVFSNSHTSYPECVISPAWNRLSVCYELVGWVGESFGHFN